MGKRIQTTRSFGEARHDAGGQEEIDGGHDAHAWQGPLSNFRFERTETKEIKVMMQTSTAATITALP